MTQAIFLSYASQDANAARRICEALRAAGLEVWFDQSELRGGDAWDASIRKQIKECALFVPMISANTNAREEGYFRLEWKLAVDRSHLMADNKAFFVPVMLGDVFEPAALVPDAFRTRQWSRLNDENAIAAFAASTVKLLAGRASSGTNASSSPPSLVNSTPFVVSQSNHTFEAQNDRVTSIPLDRLGANGENSNQRPSIAVLAFANRSASADDEYFSDGLADELLNVLAKIKGLRVAARTSAFSFKGKQSTVAEIGRALNVATVLEGSMRKSGNRVRISVELVKVADGYHLWSETYDRTLDDIFAVQDDIAGAVIKELRGALLGENVSAQGVTKEIEAATSRSENPEAHRLSLQGWFFLNKRTPADIARASEFYEQALVIDPNDSRSHAGMAHVHLQLALYGTTTRDGVTTLAMLRKAGAAAEKALACDPALALPHLALSWIALIGDYDAARAMKEAEIAHSLAPDDAEVLRYVGCRHMELGRFEQAEALLARGIGLDPLSVALRVNYCMLAEFSMQLDDAKRRAQKVLEIDPSSWWIYHHLNRIARMEGRYADAVECRAKAAELRGDADAARFHRASFVNADWPQYLRALTRSPEYCYSRLELACAYAGLGEIGAAFAMLDQVLEAHEQFIGWIKVDPLLAPLHGDPRFPALLRRVGLDA